MYKQTYWGLCALGGLARTTPPWGNGARAVVEVLPRDVGLKLGAPAKVTGDDRRRGIAALERIGISFDRIDRQVIVDDPEGDALDAVYAAVAAAAARAEGFSGAMEDSASSGEGWIYSVP